MEYSIKGLIKNEMFYDETDFGFMYNTSFISVLEKKLDEISEKEGKIQFLDNLEIELEKYIIESQELEFEMLSEDSIDLKRKSIDILRRKINQGEKQIDPDNTHISRTTQLISDTIDKLDPNQGWKYAFNSKQSYDTFVRLLTQYFEYKSYDIPSDVIKVRRNCKTKLGKAIGEIHRQLSERSLMSDHEFFDILRVLSTYRELSNDELYKIVTR